MRRVASHSYTLYIYFTEFLVCTASNVIHCSLFHLQAIFLFANTAKPARKIRENNFAASLAEDITDEEDEEPDKPTKLLVARQAKQVGN